MSLANSVKQAAALEHGQRLIKNDGTISAYNPANYTVRVMLEPQQVETGWIPLKAPWIGNGWGMVVGPSLGDAVSVFFNGSPNQGVAMLGLFNDVDQPPPVPSGEWWTVHKTGSLLKFHNDGSVELTSNQDLDVTVGGNLNAAVQGNVVATIEGNATATVQGQLQATIVGDSEVTTPLLTLNGNLTVVGLTTTRGLVSTVPIAGGNAVEIEGNVHATGVVTGDTDVISGTVSGAHHIHSASGGTGDGGPPVP